MVKAKVFIVQKHFEGLPKETDFKLVEEELPPLKDGEFLSEAVYLSVDPYMRGISAKKTGTPFIGSQVAKVLESKNPKFPVGSYLVGEFGCRTHTVTDGSLVVTEGFMPAWKIPDFEGLPLSLALGVLGMPGVSAYFGFLEGCKPKSGEIVVVSGAGGAVGSIVGQIAKIKGCTVIGIAGSDEKGKWLINELKFDGFVNYKDKDFVQKLKDATPKGVDCYFDNVGGEISSQVIRRMNLYGRISVVGAISSYNDQDSLKATQIQFPMLAKRLRMEGVAFIRFTNRWFEALDQHKEWIKQGKLKYKETITDGFENLVKAFISMLQGGNTGKAIVKV